MWLAGKDYLDNDDFFEVAFQTGLNLIFSPSSLHMDSCLMLKSVLTEPIFIHDPDLIYVCRLYSRLHILSHKMKF